VPRSRGSRALGYLAEFVEEMKKSGFIQEAMNKHGIKGAIVAPHTAPQAEL
jgi:polar amino acid transport system substrate-binding protein